MKEFQLQISEVAGKSVLPTIKHDALIALRFVAEPCATCGHWPELSEMIETPAVTFVEGDNNVSFHCTRCGSDTTVLLVDLRRDARKLAFTLWQKNYCGLDAAAARHYAFTAVDLISELLRDSRQGENTKKIGAKR